MHETALIGALSIELLIKVGIPLLIVGFSVVRHLLALAAKNPAVPPVTTPTPNSAPRKNPELSDEVEAFLKNVQQRQGQGGQGQSGQGQRGRRPPTGRESSPRRAAAMGDVVEAQVVGPAPVPTLVSRGEGFGSGATFSGDAVAKEAEQLGRQTQELGAKIDQSDERLAEQIHSTFDHQLGQFDASQASSDDDTQATSQADDHSRDMATDLRLMLSDPRDIRRAIVLNEILNPPVDRW
ncbi:MAG: hypothetical protein K8T91_18600 [Planctomycetes bacterium]|nr:hypothetical protein [Planctomycetota bacterium]